MPLRISFSIFGEQLLDRTLARFEGAPEDMRPVWDELQKSFEKNERKLFATEGASGGAAWAPLSPKYAAWKMQHYPGKPILEREGDLKESLTNLNSSGSILVKEMNYAIFGTAVDYARFHAQGVGVPQRPPVQMTEAQRRNWLKIIQRHIVSEAGPASGAPT